LRFCFGAETCALAASGVSAAALTRPAPLRKLRRFESGKLRRFDMHSGAPCLAMRRRAPRSHGLEHTCDPILRQKIDDPDDVQLCNVSLLTRSTSVRSRSMTARTRSLPCGPSDGGAETMCILDGRWQTAWSARAGVMVYSPRRLVWKRVIAGYYAAFWEALSVAGAIMSLTRCTALIGLSTFLALPVRAQTTAPAGPTPDAVESVSLEQPAIFEITSISGTLKETVQQGQQLIWRGRGSPNDRRFQVTNISVAFLRDGTAGEVKMTFAGDISSLGYRPVDEAKLNLILRTKGGASIYSWSFGLSVRCSDRNRPAPLTEQVPSDLAANVFTNVGTVEIAEYREPNYPRVMVRRCPS
jgi:hypothetical protein